MFGTRWKFSSLVPSQTGYSCMRPRAHDKGSCYPGNRTSAGSEALEDTSWNELEILQGSCSIPAFSARYDTSGGCYSVASNRKNGHSHIFDIHAGFVKGLITPNYDQYAEQPEPNF